MDELHVLLLAAVAVQNTDLAPLEHLFSLPANVIAKELADLEAYGLAEKVNGTWMATSRGRRITAVWTSFNRRGANEVAATGRQWLLGPGEFTVDEMIRDKSEINDLARGFGITDAESAVKHLEDRRRAAERFESFLVDWARSRSYTKHCVFAEALVFDAVMLAETDEALSRIEELFAANVGEVVASCTPAQAAEGHPDRDGKAMPLSH